jgi:hypothetical protein
MTLGPIGLTSQSVATILKTRAVFDQSRSGAGHPFPTKVAQLIQVTCRYPLRPLPVYGF